MVGYADRLCSTSISSKAFRESDLWVKTRVPVLVVTTDNQIPRDAPKT